MKNKAIFLDRDGVINKAIVIDGKPYPPSSLEELEILEGVCEGIARLINAGYKIFIVTNQPDVGRGKVSRESVDKIHYFLKSQLAIDDIYCCFHGTDNECECRKPKPGMLNSAVRQWDVDINVSYLIGDRWRDIEAGKKAGVSTILIDYQYDEKKIKADFECSNFQKAVDYILKIY
jgi:D-glycero-D-manno-heptose 1,7-bisphosphate phosphatase